MSNALFLRQLQHLSTPILAISTFNGSPELASLLTLRAAIVFVLKTSRFYTRLLPAIAAENMIGDEVDEELERIARAGRVNCDLLASLRRPLLRASSLVRVFEPSKGVFSERRKGAVGSRQLGCESWTLSRL